MQPRFVILIVALFGLACNVVAQTAPATGDQRREYLFAPTGAKMPYRIYVPTMWNGKTSLPIVLFLHGAAANESTYLDIAGGLLRQLAEKHGYIVVSPLGFTPLGAYGNPLRLPAFLRAPHVKHKWTRAVTNYQFVNDPSGRRFSSMPAR